MAARDRRVRRIISGGQTGADRGALDAALALRISHGGSCPRGRRAEDGRIPDRYALEELPTRDYATRTRRNVADADATLIFFRRRLLRGSKLTAKIAAELGKPVLALDVESLTAGEMSRAIRAWLARRRVGVLNVAGPRESKCPGMRLLVERLLLGALAAHRTPDP